MAAVKLTFKQSIWDKACPSDVNGAKLSSALKTVEQALATEKKKSDAESIEACIEAVNETASAVKETLRKECDAKKHKDVVTGLKKFDAQCRAEIKRLQDALKKTDDGENEDGEVSDDDLLGLKLFKECIKKAKLKTSTEDGVSFCLGIHKQAEECKLVLMKKKKFANQTFKRLYKLTKSKPEMGLKRPKMTYGAAYRDPASKETLVLHIVDGAPTEIPGMVRKMEKWRKRFKQDLLPFKELSIRTPAGKPLSMTPDPDEEEVIQAATGAETENSETAKESTAPSENATAEAAAATATGENADFDDRRKEFRKARRAWQVVKEKAIQDLEAVKDGIRDYYLDDPEQFKIATGRLGQLDAIMDNLNDDLRDVLDQYVSTPKTRQADLNRLASEAKTVVDRFLNYASSDRLLNAVDDKEFADVQVKAPIEKALKDLVNTLA